MPLMVLLVLLFDWTPLWVTVYFLGVISTREEVFLEGLGFDGKEILSMDSYLNKAPICGGYKSAYHGSIPP